MPGLVWLGRRWNMASDEFVVGGALAGLSHGIWCTIAIVLSCHWYSDSTSPCPHYATRQAFALCYCLVDFALFAAFVALSYASSKGLVFEPSKRPNVPRILTFLFVLIIVQFAVSLWGTILVVDFSPSECKDQVVLIALTVVMWILWLLPCCTVLFYWDFGGRDVKSHTRDETYDRKWFRRCRWMCCCVIGRNEPQEGSYEFEVFESVSRTMSAIFQNIDLTPSDVTEGLVLMNLKQTAKRNRLRTVTTDTKEMPLLKIPVGEVDRDHVKRMLDYSKYYLAVYGALIYWWTYLCTGPIRLLSLMRCCNPYSFKSVGEGYFRFDSTALLAFTKLTESEVLFAHFGTKMCLPGFFVATPRDANEIVVAVRGTLSLQDCVTDAFSTPTALAVKDLPAGEVFVHEGMLLSARNIIKMLKEEGVLPQILSSGKNIKICGHSLGAGVATILSIVLRVEYPELRDRVQCFAYSPPGGLLSRNLSTYTETFVEACLVENDVIPRLSQVTMEELRNGMIKAMGECRRSKADVLQHVARCGCCVRTSAYYFEADDSEPLTHSTGSDESATIVKALLENRKDPESVCTRLFPPGNIIHLVPVMSGKNRGMFSPMRMGVEELQEILVTPAMIGDHMPDRVLAALQSASLLAA